MGNVSLRKGKYEKVNNAKSMPFNSTVGVGVQLLDGTPSKQRTNK